MNSSCSSISALLAVEAKKPCRLPEPVPGRPFADGVKMSRCKGYTCKPYLDLTKYRMVKKMNKRAMNTPTANARKNNTVEGALPTNDNRLFWEVAVDVLVPEDSEPKELVVLGSVSWKGTVGVVVDMVNRCRCYSVKRKLKKI